MRTGYTTGACAAAAAKAATIALLSGEPVREVAIRLPIGEDATFQIHRCEINRNDEIYRSIDSEGVIRTETATCSVIKDGGDDPDVTSGAEICVRVWRADDTAIAALYADATNVVADAIGHYSYAEDLMMVVAGNKIYDQANVSFNQVYDYLDAAEDAVTSADIEAAASALSDAYGEEDVSDRELEDSLSITQLYFDKLPFDRPLTFADYSDPDAAAKAFDDPNDIEAVMATIWAAYHEGTMLSYNTAHVIQEKADSLAEHANNGGGDNLVVILGGEGVGTVTKRGTGIDVGDASITRIPRRMITQSVMDAAASFDSVSSFIVEISVPGGQEIAKKTDNPRLGIVGGISILGTTGVVQPFSTAAWRASVNVSIDVAAANNLTHMVITTGTQSELFAKHWLGLEDMSYVNVGIFTGSALKRCVQRGIPRATLVGMIGKFSKIAMGYFVTHVAGNKVDPVFLASLAAECGASEEVQGEMRDAASGRHFQEIALEHGVMSVFDLMCVRVCDAARAYLGDRADDLIVDAICFDFEGGILGKATTSASPIPLVEAVASDD